MALPAQVEQDLKEIEELEKSLAAPDAPVEEGLGESVEETVEDVAPDFQEPEEPEQKEPEKVESQPSEDFEQKYRTLRGKYDAEVPRLHDQVKELTSQYEDLKKLLETKSDQQPESEPKTYVTDADREEYGDEMIDLNRRAAREVVAPYEAKIARLESHIEKLEKRLDETGGQMDEMTFEQRLHRLVPDFEQVNVDPKWIAWLGEYDPMVRGPRGKMAQQAYAAGDAEAVADYIKMFKQTQAPSVEKSSKNSELEKQVTPSRTTSVSTPTNSSNQVKMYSEVEMNRVWARIDTLNKAGRYDEANKLEAEISAALVEGRVK